MSDLTDTTDEQARVQRLYATTDAQVWAREWCAVACQIEAADDGRTVIDEGWMISWFANAIQTADDHARASGKYEVSPDDPREQAKERVYQELMTARLDERGDTIDWSAFLFVRHLRALGRVEQ